MDLDDEICLCFRVSKRKVVNFMALPDLRCKTSQSGRSGESVILSEAKNLAYFAGNGDPSLRSG